MGSVSSMRRSRLLASRCTTKLGPTQPPMKPTIATSTTRRGAAPARANSQMSAIGRPIASNAR